MSIPREVSRLMEETCTWGAFLGFTETSTLHKTHLRHVFLLVLLSPLDVSFQRADR